MTDGQVPLIDSLTCLELSGTIHADREGGHSVVSTVEIPRLRVTVNLLLVGASFAAAGVTFAAFLVPADTPLTLRVLIALALAGAPFAAYLAWFTFGWVRSHWQRSAAYPQLQHLLRQREICLREERELRAALEVRVALATGVTSLPGAKLIRRGDSVRLLLPVGHGSGLRLGEVLLLVDPWRVIATAEVEHVDDARAEASLTWFADPLAEGWFRTEVGFLATSMPEGTAVFSQRAIRGRLEELEHQAPQQEATDV
jgi:hypothetical protein